MNNVKSHIYHVILVLFYSNVTLSVGATQPNALNSLQTCSLMFTDDVKVFLVTSAVICASGSVVDTHAHTRILSYRPVCVQGGMVFVMCGSMYV